LNEEQLAALSLFSIIESGQTFWSGEVKRNGAIAVKTALELGFYDNARNDVSKVKNKLKVLNLEPIILEIESLNSRFICATDKDWPLVLNDLMNPPIGLVIGGQIENWSQIKESVSIVGTRNPTNYGGRIASDFASGLADRQVAVVSGGALGIDSAAHYGALAAEGLTIAVLAGGMAKPYPLSNSRLFSEIKEKGILISEALPSTPALPHRFLIRNRLIAALSKGTLVVEAAFRSGSLRTARDAAELLRPVFAIPGPINSPQSQGCHKLISDRCAELVSSVDEIMELISPLA
jgi:DNA processing protein